MSPAANPPEGPLALAKYLTQKTQALCEGLESGAAAILDMVTPTTAELLKWWFGEDMVTARAGRNFHEGQKQAILNTIVAHEVLSAGHTQWTLQDLYQAVLPDDLLTDERMAGLSGAKHAHPKYCMKMATGTGKTWVLQALLIWQLLNKTQHLTEATDDPRFTRHFMIVAPGLIVYERLLDAFCGKQIADGLGARDFSKSDLAQFADLFIPEAHRERVFAFVRSNVCTKAEIGLKATGNGMIAITNWHLLAEGNDIPEDMEDTLAPGLAVQPKQVVHEVLPLTPGIAKGNSLEVLDRRYARGNVLEHLAQLPELMVFNDEAHHIHDFLHEGETTEVEWQKSLTRLAANKGRRFVQVDFSATPYNDVGTGKRKKKAYFAHVVVDFDLKSAMRGGLVKSIVLDKRKEINTLPLEFRALRDDNGGICLSDGQRVMLRAGLTKLHKLEKDFAELHTSRPPKMLVVCEDTAVTPLVAKFLCEEQGLHSDEVLTIDSGKKAELSEAEWARTRERLFNVDKLASPKVIVSVLMLREGFDVSNICVIVPLRSSQAPILMEQIVGRGLRLMWREEEFSQIKNENRQRINAGQEPGSLLDVLSIVEHPAFQNFYDELIAEGLAGSLADDSGMNAAGDVITAQLREDFPAYDFAIPFVLNEAEHMLDHAPLDVSTLAPFMVAGHEQLQTMLGQGETFISHDLQSATLFGDYTVDGAPVTVASYNDYLSRLTRRIGQALSEPLPTGRHTQGGSVKPYMQFNTADLTGWLDDYIWTQLFNEPFNPLENNNWRLLLLTPVMDHIVRIFSAAMHAQEIKQPAGKTEVRLRYLSEVPQILVRAKYSTEVHKCIYTRLGWPSQAGGLEREFIEWAQSDAKVLAFCKISEHRHTFLRLRYFNVQGMTSHYHPDFLVRTSDMVFLVETKAQSQTQHPNVLRKQRAALDWCQRINLLSEEERQSPPWHYVLLDQKEVVQWKRKGAHLADLLNFARLTPPAEPALQLRLI